MSHSHLSSEKIAPCLNFKKTAADSDIKSARCIQNWFSIFLDDAFRHRMTDSDVKSERYIRLFTLFFRVTLFTIPNIQNLFVFSKFQFMVSNKYDISFVLNV